MKEGSFWPACCYPMTLTKGGKFFDFVIVVYQTHKGVPEYLSVACTCVNMDLGH